MNYEFLVVALLAISVFTNLTVEAIKKVLDKKSTEYSSNVLAAFVAVGLSIISSICYLLYAGVAFDVKMLIQIIVLAYMSFLVSTLGYDKVIQSMEQVRKIK